MSNTTKPNQTNQIEDLKKRIDSLRIISEYEQLRASIEEFRLKRLMCITKIAQIKTPVKDGSSQSS